MIVTTEPYNTKLEDAVQGVHCSVSVWMMWWWAASWVKTLQLIPGLNRENAYCFPCKHHLLVTDYFWSLVTAS